MSEKHIGEVVQVIGPVLDIRFAHDELPPLLNAIEIDNDGAKLVAEVAQQVGDDVVRCIAMNSTDGLVRGAKALDTGGPISVPVGEECLGRPGQRRLSDVPAYPRRAACQRDGSPRNHSRFLPDPRRGRQGLRGRRSRARRDDLYLERLGQGR